MPSRSTFSHRLLAGSLALAIVSSFVPLGIVASRKVAQAGRADVLFSRDGAGLLVRSVGKSARSAGLREGDVILSVDGREAMAAGDPGDWLARRPADVLLLRGGELRQLRTQAIPAPWDFRYFFLLAAGMAFLAAGLAALAGARKSPKTDASTLFAAFALCVGLVLGLTPVPPVDALFRTSVLLEDVARAFFPALLLLLVFTFPRRSSSLSRGLAFLPAAALLAATWSVYFGGKEHRDAAAAVAALDRLQVVWIATAVLVTLLRLLRLWQRPGDLLAEKQVRYLLLGTATGLLPVVALNLLPGLFGLSIPILSAVSIVPLVLVPFAFLAALTRFRLWDAEVFGRESAALVGAGLAGAALFAAAQTLLARVDLPNVPYARSTLQVAAGLVLALSFVPARRGLSAALARLQFGEAWSAREELLALVRELATPRSAAEVEQLLVSRTTRALGAAPAALLPLLPGARLPAVSVDGGEPIALAELPPETSRRTVRLSRQTFLETPTAAVARLRAAGFRTLSPLAASGRLLAVFALGDRLGRVPLSHEDLGLLETVLAPAALALDHARLYDEVRAQAESYRLLKEFHEDVVAGSAAAIASTDGEGRFSSVNPAFASLSGRAAEKLVGRTAEEVLPEALLGDDPPRRLEADLGAGLRVLDVAVSLFPGAPQGSRARVYVLHDATETARLERALAERERLAALGSLSAGVAHEVNTPLAGVAGFARYLLDETPEGDPRRPVLEKIERQAFRASRLVRSLLDLARGVPRERVPLDPCLLAREAARVFEEEIGTRGVHLTLTLPVEAPRVEGHADALLQVFVNLLKNGAEAALSGAKREAGAAPPAVGLTVRAEEGKVLFLVEDNGPGLPPVAAKRVFEPFFSTKTSQGGTGLGLTIARDIIRAHGGSLEVAPGVDGGARFVVALPPAP